MLTAFFYLKGISTINMYCSPSTDFLCPTFYELNTNDPGGESSADSGLEFQQNVRSSMVNCHRDIMMRKQNSVTCANQCCQQKL